MSQSRAYSLGRLSTAVVLAVLFLPICITFLYVRAFSVEMPFMDDWDIVIPQLAHIETGTLHWSDINVQHNESVILFPQLVYLAAARLLGYQVLAPIYISFGFLCGSLLVLFLFFRRLRLPGRGSLLWFLPVSVFFMSWRQSEGLLWSTHLLNTMALFFSLLALYCCLDAHRSRLFFAAALVSTGIASFSMASGVLSWALGWIYLALLSPSEARRARLWRVAAWSLFGALCCICFLFDRPVHSIGWHAGLSYAWSHLGTAGRYGLIYLGSPFSHDPDRAVLAGAAFAIIAVVSVYFTIAKGLRQAAVSASLLLIAMVLFSLGPLLLFRMQLGSEEAISSRYVTLLSVGPVGVYFCLIALLHKTPAARYLLVALAALFVLGTVDAYASGLEDGRENHADLIQCAAIVRDYHHRAVEDLECAYPEPQAILGRAAHLERHRLSLFRWSDGRR
ncbi:MAG TPA: hypothetical protein VLY04_19680 [Bryobacteraceae bacterium]|nr:hypothetical protein [Bryobacteraceae bacterium]